jgi:hypothetical protein
MEATEVAVIITSVGALVVTIGGLFWKWVNNDAKIAREAQKDSQIRATAEREMMSKYFADSLKLLSEATERNTKAQERTADEAKERNGHLAELQLKSPEMIDRNFEFYKKGFTELKCQKVKKQTVDEQVIKHQTEE